MSFLHSLSCKFAISTILACVLLLGCGRKNPVNLVSVKESGIDVVNNLESGLLDTGDWPQWRGPSGNGNADHVELPTSWDVDSNVTWRADVPGRGHSSPIVVGNLVMLATALEDKQEQRVLAYDRTDGTVVWSTVVHQGGFPDRGEVHQKATNANGTLASDGQRVYIAMLNSDAITATSLDMNGEIVWQREVGKFVSKFGYAPSPVLYKNLVIFAADNSGGGYITAVDSANGKIAWRISRGDESSYSTPHIAFVGDRDQLLISGSEAVASYDPATGDELWRTTCTARSTCGTVITSGDRILASGGYPDKQTVCLSASGEIIWSNRTKIYEPSLVIVGDNVVGVNDDGVAFCWSVKDGKQRWKKRLGGNFSASPIVSGNTVLVPNLSGDTFVFNANNDSLEMISENHLGDDCYASPAASNGQLFLRVGIGSGRDRTEELVCIGPSEETEANESAAVTPTEEDTS